MSKCKVDEYLILDRVHAAAYEAEYRLAWIKEDLWNSLTDDQKLMALRRQAEAFWGDK